MILQVFLFFPFLFFFKEEGEGRRVYSSFLFLFFKEGGKRGEEEHLDVFVLRLLVWLYHYSDD